MKNVEILSQRWLYAPQCSDISNTDDELLVLTTKEVENENRFHDPKTDKEIFELQAKQLKFKWTFFLYSNKFWGFFLDLHHQLCKKYVGLLTRLKSDNKIATKSLNTVR